MWKRLRIHEERPLPQSSPARFHQEVAEQLLLCPESHNVGLDCPPPVMPKEPEREAKDTDDDWEKKKRDYGPLELAYSINKQKWNATNKKSLAFLKNTIENAIAGSIAECATVGEFFDKVKSQFTGSSKIYGTQLLKQLVTEKYTGGGHGIREHILRLSNMAAKLKAIDPDLEIKSVLLIHIVMASLPKEFENFVVNYNMSPDKWDMEKTIAMCVQEEDRLKEARGGSINYVKENKKRNFNGSPSKPHGKGPAHHQSYQKPIPVDKDTCLFCKKPGHYKKDCPAFLKNIMAKNGKNIVSFVNESLYT